MLFTPATLALWLSSAENVDAITTLLESGDLRLASATQCSEALRLCTQLRSALSAPGC